ncbi:perlucin-like protein [Mytilus californianus]|uniref:perlucin-like protein n=1 Tax=Mytilus californianus TaxID=6549 RepID=UPI0022474389|nr:perlucin-like protein [Mytilus californianus]
MKKLLVTANHDRLKICKDRVLPPWLVKEKKRLEQGNEWVEKDTLDNPEQTPKQTRDDNPPTPDILQDSGKLCEVIGRQYGRSASLATVDDAKTQQFLTDLMIKINSIGMYIGLNDLVTEGTFHWVANGKQATYFNWGPTQPNNRGGNENCVAMRVDPVIGFNYSWTDGPCTVPTTYICEMVAADIGNLLG